MKLVSFAIEFKHEFSVHGGADRQTEGCLAEKEQAEYLHDECTLKTDKINEMIIIANYGR